MSWAEKVKLQYTVFKCVCEREAICLYLMCIIGSRCIGEMAFDVQKKSNRTRNWIIEQEPARQRTQPSDSPNGWEGNNLYGDFAIVDSVTVVVVAALSMPLMPKLTHSHKPISVLHLFQILSFALFQFWHCTQLYQKRQLLYVCTCVFAPHTTSIVRSIVYAVSIFVKVI